VKKELTTKIISGIYKNKVLKLPALETTRSSKTILKESFFNTLQFDVVDSTFCELFAGSGSIGLEALSRGAKKIYFIEKNKNSYKILNENINNINNDKCISYNANTFEKFNELLKQIKEPSYFYIDPPFEIRVGFEDIYQNVINLINKIPKELIKMVIIEHHSNINFDEVKNLEKIKTKKFGKSSLTYFK
jgi:16S rRNA (guanine(966)-N(2))-methyltransferase RsmD